MGVKEKIANAKPSSSLTEWLTENMTEEEIQEIVTKAKEKAKKRIVIYDALDSLRDFDKYSPYQKDLSTVIDYIEELEKEIEDLKEAKAIYVERPKTMQEKQAESERYEKAFDDGYESGYAQARFDYEQPSCEDAVSRQALIDKATSWDAHFADSEKAVSLTDIMSLPTVTPNFTDEEIQKMQDLEQAQLEKAYELGIQTSFEEWLLSFNTESATCCFTAVQELKKRLEDEKNDKV